MVQKSLIIWVWSQLLVWSGEYDPNILYDPIFLDHKFPWSREYDLSNYHDPRFSRFSPMVLQWSYRYESRSYNDPMIQEMVYPMILWSGKRHQFWSHDLRLRYIVIHGPKIRDPMSMIPTNCMIWWFWSRNFYDPTFMKHTFPWSHENDLGNFHDPRILRFSSMVLKRCSTKVNRR